MIVFENEGLLDLHAITTFGASVKEGKNPIGMFGTGLKYAIAVLLRHDQGIRIAIDGQLFAFGVRNQAIRGKDFQMVEMYRPGTFNPNTGQYAEGVPCGFTTELGKHWELWMAYRELACNCMDESGKVYHQVHETPLKKGMTQIFVTGQDFHDVWQDRKEYILEGEPHLRVRDRLEVWMTPNDKVYYRGVMIGKLEVPSLCTYNLLHSQELTEDRTLKWGFMVGVQVRHALLETDNRDFVKRAVTAASTTLEGKLDYRTTAEPSALFKQVVMEEYRKDHLSVVPTAVSYVRTHEKAAFRPTIKKITPLQDKSLTKAIEFCKEVLGFDLDRYPIHVVEHLGESTLAMAMDGEIWLSDRVFELGGTKAVASTLMEEFLHLDRGLMDESRAMQQYLFDKIVTMGEQLKGDPL